MLSLRITVMVLLAAANVRAADAAWKNKPSSEWTAEDVKEVLTASPWVREIKAGVVRRLTEEQLREGGLMGQPTGVGYDGVDPKGSGPKVSPNIFTGPGGEDRSIRSRSQSIPLKVRWESALPMRLAELRTHEIAPLFDGEGYQIVVYGIPGGDFKEDPKQLGEPLKKTAALKRAGKKDVKPTRVEVFQLQSGLAAVYLFPLSAEITKKDELVTFDAKIGRIYVLYPFDVREMDYLGKLEL
jgi:hypothetical protein